MTSAVNVLLSLDSKFYDGQLVLPPGGASLSTSQSNASAERPLSFTLSSNGDFISERDSISPIFSRWCSATDFSAGNNNLVRLVPISGPAFTTDSAAINAWIPLFSSPKWRLARPGSGQTILSRFNLEFSTNVTFPFASYLSGPWVMTFSNTG